MIRAVNSMCVRPVMYVNVVFFVTDAATTEIYTYLHTLSLHDALPIYARRMLEALHAEVRGGEIGPPRDRTMVSQQHCHVPREKRRSEEHPSELQSLMRNSYAAFCVKKKTSFSENQQLRHSIYTTSSAR